MEAVLIIAAGSVVLALVAGAVSLSRWQKRRARRKQAIKLEQAVMIGGQAAVKGAIRTAARVREEGMGAMLRAPVEALSNWAELEHPELRRISRDGTVTIMFSDIEDSTALNHELGDRRWLKVLGAHDEVVRREVGNEAGHVVKSQGDGFMIAFAEPAEAIRCAVAIQQNLSRSRGPLKKTPVSVRIGIHSGKAVTKKGDLYGRNVALAARVAEQAEGSEILISAETMDRATREGAASTEEPGFSFGSPREADLKGLGTEKLVPVDWKPPA